MPRDINILSSAEDAWLVLVKLVVVLMLCGFMSCVKFALIYQPKLFAKLCVELGFDTQFHAQNLSV